MVQNKNYKFPLPLLKDARRIYTLPSKRILVKSEVYYISCKIQHQEVFVPYNGCTISRKDPAVVGAVEAHHI